MTTANEIIGGSLRLITSLSPGEGIPGDEASEALAVLNGMLAAWSTDNLMPPCRTLESFSLAAGISSRTIGSGAQLDTARPDSVTGAYFRDGNSQDYPVDTTMTSAEHNAITLKTVGNRPRRLYYDPQYPNGVIYFDSATDAAYTLFLESLKPFNQFSTLQTTMALPGEYLETIKYLLAKRLAPEYGFEIQGNLADLIDKAERRMKRKNLRMKTATVDPALATPKRFNIYAG